MFEKELKEGFLKTGENSYTINHARMDVINKLNRYGDEFLEFKKAIFYYDENLKCFTSKLKE